MCLVKLIPNWTVDCKVVWVSRDVKKLDRREQKNIEESAETISTGVTVEGLMNSQDPTTSIQPPSDISLWFHVLTELKKKKTLLIREWDAANITGHDTSQTHASHVSYKWRGYAARHIVVQYVIWYRSAKYIQGNMVSARCPNRRKKASWTSHSTWLLIHYPWCYYILPSNYFPLLHSSHCVCCHSCGRRVHQIKKTNTHITKILIHQITLLNTQI